MKNKDRYTLTELKFIPKYQIDGCGKRIPKPFYLDIVHKGERVAELFVGTNLLEAVTEWLESN